MQKGLQAPASHDAHWSSNPYSEMLMEALFIPVSLSEYIIILFAIVFSEFKILRHYSLESLDSNRSILQPRNLYIQNHPRWCLRFGWQEIPALESKLLKQTLSANLTISPSFNPSHTSFLEQSRHFLYPRCHSMLPRIACLHDLKSFD